MKEEVMKKLIAAAALSAAIIVSVPAHADSSSDQLTSALYALGVNGGLNFLAQLTNPQEDAMADSKRALWEARNGGQSDYPNFICNSDPVECSYQRGIYDQAKEQWNSAKDAAYNCGRYGKDCQ
tara:strand:+ start:473 stop:844 length:372 start_codon:yes stop_codon:yes gene_type:complete